MTKQRETFVCLMYHNVPATAASYAELSPSIRSYFVERELFARQMQMLEELGATCWGPQALAGFYAEQGPGVRGQGSGINCPVPRPVVLTFDDGWRESVDTAGPILESHGYTVLEARNGREGLLLFEQHQGPIDLDHPTGIKRADSFLESVTINRSLQ